MPDTPLWYITKRELQHGWRQFGTYLACLIFGVMVMATIGTLSASIRHAMEGEADTLLGGHAEVSLNSGQANTQQLAALAHFGRISHVVTTRAMLRHGMAPLLIEAKAVDSAYPLIGELKWGGGAKREEVFTPDALVVDEALLHRLGAKLGDKVTIGRGAFTLTAVLEKEPDRTVQVFAFGPRVMMSQEAMERSGITEGYTLARHHYRILLNDRQNLDSLKEALKKIFPAGTWRLKTGTDGNETVNRFIDQLTLFLTLSALATFLIGGIGIGSAIRTFMERKSESIAVMKTLGASRRQLLQVYSAVIFILSLFGSLAGIALATGVTAFFLPIIGQWLPVENHGFFDPSSALLSGWFGMLISFLFSLPYLLQALDIRPSLLFRHASGITPLPQGARLWPVLALGIALLLATLFWHFRDWRFIGGFAGVALLSFLLFGGISRLLQKVARRITTRKPWLRLALGNLHRPGATTGTVVLAIGVSLTVLIAVTLTEANFQHRITQVIRADAPSLFMMDIQPEQTPGLYDMLKSYARRDAMTGEPMIMMYPMVRGRIVALNGKPVEEEQVSEDVQWAIRGDRGLSHSAALPENAQITKGSWWPADYKGKPLVSVDERFLPGMKLKIGDTMTFDIMGEEITAEIASARKMDYSTFQMNFAVMFSPGVIDDFPQSLLATVYLPDDEALKQRIIAEVTERFSNVTSINTSEAITQVKAVLEKVSTALSLSVAVSLIAGILVLSGALSAMLSYRLYDTAVLKVLGARRRDILLANTGEWVILAAVTALFAAVLGTFGAWLIMLRFPGDRDFLPMPEVTLVTLLGCIAVICLVGYLGNRQVFRLRPAGLLRNE